MKFLRRLRCVLEGVHVTGPGVACPYCLTRNPPYELYVQRRAALEAKLLRPFDIAGPDRARYGDPSP